MPASPVPVLPRIDFVLGGARSGKTRIALDRAEASGLAPVMVATASAGDTEMADRIARHRAERGPRWSTIEEGVDLAGVFAREARPDRVMVVDCLTLWLSNVTFSDRDVEAEIATLIESLRLAGGPIILVSNEIGLGLVPADALSRRFRDHQGRLNQRVAAVADRVTFVAAGLPLVMKGG
jgi:adenosylcobinamide kinase/adenosylcobinamide-phosphate guanylyltransferase